MAIYGTHKIVSSFLRSAVSTVLEAHHIVLDVDTGRDDAWTIMGAIKQHEVRALITSYGNTSVELATRNTLDIVKLAQNEMPGLSSGEKNLQVWSGEEKPLCPVSQATLAEIQRRKKINGNGICDIKLSTNKELPLKCTPDNGKPEFKQWLEKQSGLTYIVCGPMSNLARLIEEFGHDASGRPLIRNHVKKLVCMGGSFDRTLFVDFNFRADPLSASRVIQTFGEDLVLVPLDETRKLRVTAQEMDALSPDHKASAVSKKLMIAHAQRTGDDFVLLNDPATLLVLENRFPLVTEKISLALEGENAGKVLRDSVTGTAVKRLVIPEGMEESTKTYLLESYLGLHPR